MADSEPGITARSARRSAPRSRRRALGCAGALVVALVLSGAGALTISAKRADLSVRAQAVRLGTVLLSDPPRDEEAYRRQVTDDQAAGPAAPSTSFRKRYAVTSATVQGSRVFTVSPTTGRSDRRVLYLHGGAYVSDLTAPYWGLVGRFVDRTGATVIVPAYPLAPRHDWRPAHSLILSVYRDLVTEVGARNIAIAGDSAGGGLTLAVAQAIRDRHVAGPAALVLFSPLLDATVSDPAQRALDERDHVLTIHGVRQAGRWWAGDLPASDPRISPLNGSMSDLPPTIVFTGTDDLLHPDAVALKTAMDAAGAPCDLVTVRHQIHAWVVFLPGQVPEARRAIDQAAELIVARTG